MKIFIYFHFLIIPIDFLHHIYYNRIISLQKVVAVKKHLNGISLAEIAKKANVSITTVSRTLNSPKIVSPNTYNTIFRAMEELGIDTKALSSIQEQNKAKELCPVILMLYGFVDDNPQATDVLKGVRAIASQRGYTCLSAYQDILEEKSIQNFYNLIQTHNIRGIIINHDMDTQTLNKLNSMVPVVQVNAVNPKANTHMIYLDDFKASYHAVNHLIARECRNIAIVNTAPESFYSCREKQCGYVAALNDAQIPVRPELMCSLSEVYLSAANTTIYSLLKTHPEVDGIFCCSDVYAVAATMVCGQLGRPIPESIKIIGYDNTNLSAMTTPKLTTVSHDKYQIGYLAAELIINQNLYPNKPMSKIILDTELIIRGSTM